MVGKVLRTCLDKLPISTYLSTQLDLLGWQVLLPAVKPTCKRMMLPCSVDAEQYGEGCIFKLPPYLGRQNATEV